ncbi:MAG: hypothetical protein IPK19_29905 [Chloroflexi bacterium]|nr:hypothetical protein [Chloroflexota bacterium]
MSYYGTPGNAASHSPSISGDGRYVFTSLARNLVSGDPFDNLEDIFVRDRQTGQTVRANIATDGTLPNNSTAYPMVSDNGRYVTFTTHATNLLPEDTDDYADVYVYDLQTHQLVLVSVPSSGVKQSASSFLRRFRPMDATLPSYLRRLIW